MHKQYTKKTHNTRNNEGFTLIEVIIVVVIISILAGISFAATTRIQMDTRDQDRNSKAATIAGALEKYYTFNGEYPSRSAILQTDADKVKTKLNLSSTDALRLPNSTLFPSFTNSVGLKDRFLYAGFTSESATAPCESPSQVQAHIDDGACTRFELSWRTEATNTYQSIRSRSGW